MKSNPIKQTNPNKRRMQLRYGVIALLFFTLSLAITVKMVDTIIIDGEEWCKDADKWKSVYGTIPPMRGKLLTKKGEILSCNIEAYDIAIDLRHPKIVEMKINMASIDSLADSLDYYYPRRHNLKDPAEIEKYSWHTRLKNALAKEPNRRSRYFLIVKKGTKMDYDRIVNFPFLKDFISDADRKKAATDRKYQNHPLYKDLIFSRVYPYGDMAHLSIGRVNCCSVTNEIHGYSGLERDLDSLLYGKPGISELRPTLIGFTKWTIKEPEHGYDIRTTIDIDIQEMLEEELSKVCIESKAEWGTAIIMEVATGEIKAISNIELKKGTDSTYIEALNRAVMAYEPGSVMKPISMMIAFEDGLVSSVNQTVDCSPFQRTSDPHAPTIKTMKQVIEMSSNTGMARVIFRGYKDDPSKFYDRLASIGFFEKMNSGIAGEYIPRVRKLLPTDAKGNKVTMTARHLDLARQAYGYNTDIPPLYTLSYYNAIANDGKYVRPHLVYSLIDQYGNDSILPIDYIRESICSPETARKVRECMREVVWGEHGTARAVRDDRVEIAGKTGTAYPVEKGIGYNKSKRRYAFAGFFPYDKPKYSCMALILGPSGTSANRTSGQVVKNMAIKLYSRGMLDNVSQFQEEKSNSAPTLCASTKVDASKVKSNLNSKNLKQHKQPGKVQEGKMPNVVGYDVQSAIKILSDAGLITQLEGNGIVVSQSIPAGAAIKRREKVTLKLKYN